MAMPRPRAAPAMGTALGPRLTGAAGGGAAVASLTGGSALSLRLEDVGDLAALRVEELVAHLAPSAKLADLEQLRWCRELVRTGGVLDDRTIALPHEQLLCLGRIEELHERLRRVEVAALVHHGGRVLDQDRLVRYDVVEVLALLLREDRLVLVAEQNITLAARERAERVAGALVEHRHLLEQLGHVIE